MRQKCNLTSFNSLNFFFTKFLSYVLRTRMFCDKIKNLLIMSQPDLKRKLLSTRHNGNANVVYEKKIHLSAKDLQIVIYS